jgi:hypothetical protein
MTSITTRLIIAVANLYPEETVISCSSQNAPGV